MMNAQLNEPARSGFGPRPAESVVDAAPAQWGVKDVIVATVAMLLLVTGVFIAAVPNQLFIEDIVRNVDVQPVDGLSVPAIDYFTALSAVVMVALAVFAATVAWVVLRVGRLPSGFIVPIATCTYLFVAVPPLIVDSGFANTIATILLPTFAIYALCAYLVFLIAHERGGNFASALNGLRLRLPSRAVHYPIALGIYAVAYVAVTVWAIGIDLLDVPEWLRVPDNASDILNEAGLPMTILLVAVIAPLGEEALFRGFALPGLASRLGVVVAILLTSAVFAVVHMGPGIGVGILPVTFILGVAFALIYHWTKSLVLAISAHALHNAITIASLAASA